MNSQELPLVRPEPRPEPQGEYSERWEKKLIELAKQTREARKGLVEEVARKRDFRFLDETMGRKPEDFPKVLDRIAEGYISGRFFLSELSLFYEVTPELSLTVYELRQEWIRQYDLETVPELMLVDQAMLAYFHTIRLNKEIANMLSLTENSLYGFDQPYARLKSYNRTDNAFDSFVAEEHIRKLQDMLLPLIDRFNQMFLRNLRALRELKTHPISINIAQAGQVNVAQQQVNVQEGFTQE